MSAAGKLREDKATRRKAEQANLRDISPEPAATAPPDQTLKLRASSALLKHVQAMRHLDYGLYQALRERQEIAQLSGDPNVLLQEIDRQKAELRASGLDRPSLAWQLRNACDRLGLNGGRPVARLLVSRIILGLLLTLYALLSAAFVYSTAGFHNPAPELWLIYAGVSLGIAWIGRAPYTRKEGLGLVAFAAVLAWMNAHYYARAVVPVASFAIAVVLVCRTSDYRYITALIFQNMPAIGIYPRYATEATVWIVPFSGPNAPFSKPSARIVYQLNALAALVFGLWVPLFSATFFWSLFIVPVMASWIMRSLWATTRRYRSMEGRRRREKRIVNGVPTWVELGSDRNKPTVAYRDAPLPQRPATVKHVPNWNPETEQYERTQVFRDGDPDVKPPVEPLPLSTIGGTSHEMTDDEGDAVGVTRNDLRTRHIPL